MCVCVYSCESFVSREMRSQPIVGSALASARGEIIGKFVTFCAGELLILSRAAWKSAQEVTGPNLCFNDRSGCLWFAARVGLRSMC